MDDGAILWADDMSAEDQAAWATTMASSLVSSQSAPAFIKEKAGKILDAISTLVDQTIVFYTETNNPDAIYAYNRGYYAKMKNFTNILSNFSRTVRRIEQRSRMTNDMQ